MSDDLKRLLGQTQKQQKNNLWANFNMENDKPKPTVQPLVLTSGQFRSTSGFVIFSNDTVVNVQFVSYEIFYRNGSLILIVFQV